MSQTREALIAILVGGLVAGTLDIGAATLISGAQPGRVLQFIAGGLVGKQAAFAGGAATMALGMVLQWLMSLVIAGLFVAASLHLSQLRQHWAIAGLAYGLPVFLVMELVVVPLSAHRHMPHFTPDGLVKNLAAMMVFGLIIAGAARWRLGD